MGLHRIVIPLTAVVLFALVLPGVAQAQGQPTLEGTTLVGTFTASAFSCSGGVPFAYRASGDVTPTTSPYYPGTFTDSGTLRPTPPGSDADGSRGFRITTSRGTVITGDAGIFVIGTCTPASINYGPNFPPGRYFATITTSDGRSFSDNGLAFSSFSGPASGGQTTLRFASALAEAQPIAPPDTAILDGPGHITNSSSASFVFTSPGGQAPGAIRRYECKLDGGDWEPCGSNTRTYTGLSDGPHTLSVRAIDGAGNVDPTPATRTWIVDTVAPETTITAGPAATTTATNASFSFVLSDQNPELARLECKLDEGPWEACASPRELTGLTEGRHTFSIRAIDAAGTTDATPATHTWTVTAADTAPPETTITAGPSSTSNASWATFEFSSSEAGSTFECKLDDGAFSPCSSPRTLSGLRDGLHTFSVRAIDAAGNTDPSPATRTWTIDTFIPDTAPPETTITAGPSGTTRSRSATFEFTASETQSTFECALDAAPFAPCTSPRTFTALSDGGHTVLVRARDAAGNTDPSPASRTWTVEDIAPGSAPQSGSAPQPGQTPPATAPTVEQIEAALGADLSALARGLRRFGISRLVRRRGFMARDLDALAAGRFVLTVSGNKSGASIARRVVLGRGSRSVGGAGRYAVKLRLTRGGRRLLRRDKRAKVTLTLTFREASGRSAARRTSVRLSR